MGNHKKPGEVGYGDVAQRLIDASRKWGGMWSYTVTADRSRTGEPRLFIVLERRRVDGDDHSDAHTRVWTAFPGSRFGSFASHLYELCDECDRRLEARAIEREAQTEF